MAESRLQTGAPPPDGQLRLLLVRHAETAFNQENRVQGRADHPLSERGHLQAAALAERLRGETLAAVYTSPLQRAQATARALAAPQNVLVRLEPALAEMDVGEMEGLALAEMRARYPQFLQTWVGPAAGSLRMPGGESLDEVGERAWAVVERLAAQHREETVALVSHNFVLATLITRALEMPVAEFRRFRLSVAGLTVLAFRPHRTMLVQLNDTCHLAEAHLLPPDARPAAPA